MKSTFTLTLALLTAFTFTSQLSHADDLASKGRTILEARKATVITIELVINQKFSFPGMPSDDMEMKIEATGTLIGADGLTVVSLTETDPSALFESMMAGMGQMDGFKIDSEIKTLKMILADNTELDAEVVLRDKDLDMAFIRPVTKPEEALPHVNLSESGDPKHLDHVVNISRMGRVVRRAHAVSTQRVSAIVTKPRKFYIVGSSSTLQSGVGAPAFTTDGHLIGVYFLRVIKSSSGNPFAGPEDNMAVILLPAIDIREAAEQAPPFK
ncbi:MAG: serine protease [Candidatus Hydrogenedentota bacterium]